MKHHTDWPMLAAVALIGTIGLVALVVAVCNRPAPLPAVLPTTTIPAATALPTPGPTLTTVIAGPPSPHATSTYRPTPTAFVVVPSLIPTLAPATITPDVLPVILPPFGPPPTIEGQHLVAPPQIPEKR